MGIVRIFSMQFQNGVVGQYPDAAQQLANLAVATGVYGLLHAALIFLPETANVYSRTPLGRRQIFRFSLAVSFGLTVPLLYLTLFPGGSALLQGLFNLDSATAGEIQSYFLWLTPLLVLDGMKHYQTGLLIQAGRTRLVSGLNVFFLIFSITTLFTGLALGFPALMTVGASQFLSHLVVFVLTTWACHKYYRLPQKRESVPAKWRDMWQFFWPVALTGVMFALSRPILYGFVSRQPDAVTNLASLRVAFDFSMLFLTGLNGFRAVFVTFGRDDPEGVRRFLVKVMLVVGISMLVFSVTPLSTFVFGTLMGLEGEVLQGARQAMMALSLIPWAMAMRNYFHGLAMANRTTGRMGVGAFLRVGVITLFAWLLAEFGMLNHTWAALILFFGFLVETIFNAGFTLFRRRGRGLIQ